MSSVSTCTLLLSAVFLLSRLCSCNARGCSSTDEIRSAEKATGHCLNLGRDVFRDRPNPFSCSNRCGSISNTRADWMCSCDLLCTIYQDCCIDFVDECTIYAAGTSRPEKTTVECKDTTNGYFLLVAGCPKGEKGSVEAALCEHSKSDILSEIPVFDNKTKIHYKNYHCAACNGVRAVQFWKFILDCEGTATEPIQVTFQELMVKRNDSKCRALFNNTHSYDRLCTENYINKCSKDCDVSPEIVSECARYQLLFSYFDSDFRSYHFKNPTCAMCNNISLPLDNCLAQWPALRAGAHFWKFSYSLLVNVNPSGELNVGLSSSVGQKNSSAQAVCETLGLDDCQIIRCQDGYENIDGRCQIRNILSKVVLNITYERSDRQRVLQGYELIKKLSQYFTWHLEPDIVFSDTNPGVRTSVVIKFLQVHNLPCDYEIEANKSRETIMTLNARLATWFEQNAYGEFVDIVATNYLEQNCNNTITANNTDCARVSFPRSLFKLYQNGSALFNNTVLLDSTEFVMVDNKSVLICKDKNLTIINATSSPPPVTEAMGIVTVVCLIISELCLLVRIILQFFVPLYRSFPGKLQLIVSISLFVSNISFMVKIQAANHLEACVVVGAFTQWAFLVYFFSMNTIAFDLWRTFSQDRVQAGNRGNRRILQYLIYSCTIPTIIVTITVGIQYSDANINFRPNFTAYGLCWLQGRPLLIYFGIPFMFVIISNVVFYVLAAISIRKSRELSRQARDASESGFAVYVKLCVLIGLTWIVAFVAPFIRHEAFDYVFIILNTLHGAYIFIGFVCTRRIYNELFKSRRYKAGTKPRGTIEVPLSCENSASTPPRREKFKTDSF